MRQQYLIPFPLLASLLWGLWGAPGLAESPTEGVIDEMRAINVQRLRVTNACYQCDLVGVDLSHSHLIGADLRGAQLLGANLAWSNLEGADLTGANLTGANFTGTFMTNAHLVNANVDEVNFSQAQLYFVDVTGASMENINLAGATVEGTAISIGGGEDPLDIENQDLPILAPEDTWRLPPPQEPWHVPGPPIEEILDIPQQILPQV